jgi:hypothetical protein
MMAFCQRTAILVGPAAVDAEPTDLTLKEIVGGGEPEVTQDGRVEVTKETVTEVLDTGLFSSRGQNRVGWAHYTYVEFLASEYVLAHQLTPEQTSSLIMHPLDPTRVVPQLHGTAGWIAGADEVMFERICASDPQVSLRSDTGTMDSLSHTSKARNETSRPDSPPSISRRHAMLRSFRRSLPLLHSTRRKP